MLQNIQISLEAFVAWAEDCPCHGHLLSNRDTPQPRDEDERVDDKRRKIFFERLLSAVSAHTDCPAKGLRACEFAAGEYDEILSAFLAVAEDLMLQMATASEGRLSSADIGSVMEDWHLAKAFLQLELQSKLQFWQTLPWLVAGLVHYSEDVASKVAKKMVSILQRCQDPAFHHRLIAPWLGEELFSELVCLAERTCPRRELRLLLSHALPYKFMPTTERPIEKPHSMVERSLHGKKKK